MTIHPIRTARSNGSCFSALSAAALATLAALSLGCASYQGTAKEARPSTLVKERGWVVVPEFPLILQQGTKDCGAAALAAVLQYWGKPTTPDGIASSVGRQGERLRAADLEQYARSQGMSAYVFFGTMKDVVYEVERGRPVIVGVGKPYAKDKAVSHYEVVVGFDASTKQVLFLDPGRGWQVDSFEGFAREWAASKAVTVVTFMRAPKVRS